MRSPNAVLGRNNENKEQNAESQAEKTGWDDLANEADKKDWAAQSVENEYNQLNEQREQKQEKLDKLREQMDSLAKKSDEYYYDSGSMDIRSSGGGKSERLQKEIDELAGQLGETDSRYGRLSSAAGREELAQEKRREAAVKEEMEEWRREQMSKANTEAINEKYNLSPEAKRQQLIDRINETGEDFAENISDSTLASATLRESRTVNKLMKEYNDYINGNKHSFFEKRAHDKNVKELERYGLSPNGSKSSDLRELERLLDPYSATEADRADFSKRRAEEWRKTQLYMARGDERAIKKALKKEGLSTRMPEKWNDPDFTSHEIHEIYQIAKNEMEHEQV